MANLTVYTVNKLIPEDFKIFMGLYNDFKNRAINDFKFELDPLEYEDFTKAVQNGLLECLVLLENSIPTGFLIYTTLISYSIELNMIYLISDENYETKTRFLLNDFFKREKDLISKKIITYPLLGEQEKYKDVLYEFGFNNVSQSVLRFDFSNPTCISKLNNIENFELPYEYTITNWDNFYIGSAIKLIHNNFQSASDSLFDPRFKTFDGVKDILKKIVNSNYGEFLPQYTKIIHRDNRPIGICFANLTSDNLVNIPLVAVDKQFRGQKLGEKMVYLVTKEVLEDTMNGIKPYTEINVTTDSFNTPAMKMYEFCGFIEDYRYSQSFREPNN